MAEETTTKTAKPAAAPVAPETAAAIATALRQSNAHRFGPPNEGPTERMRAAAAAIKGGQSARAAMAAAGYGRKYIAGNATVFPGLLASQGLLTQSQAHKAAAMAAAGGDE